MIGSFSLREHSRPGRAMVFTTSRGAATPAALHDRADPPSAGNSGNSHPLLICSRMGSQRPGVAHHCAIAWRMSLPNCDARGRVHVDLNPAVSPDSQTSAKGGLYTTLALRPRTPAPSLAAAVVAETTTHVLAVPARHALLWSPSTSAPRRPRTTTEFDSTHAPCGTLAAALCGPFPINTLGS